MAASAPASQPRVTLVESSLLEAYQQQQERTQEVESELKKVKQQLIDLQLLLNKELSKRESLAHAVKLTNTHKQPTEKDKPIGKTTRIQSGIRTLIEEKVGSGEMTWKEATKTFKVSKSSVWRIVSDARKKKAERRRFVSSFCSRTSKEKNVVEDPNYLATISCNCLTGLKRIMACGSKTFGQNFWKQALILARPQFVNTWINWTSHTRRYFPSPNAGTQRVSFSKGNNTCLNYSQ
jgi:hypothetical protein